MPVRRPRLPDTEQPHPGSEDLDLQSTLQVVRRLHAEDHAAVEAVGQVLPEIAEVARLAAQAIGSGGRMIYVGAGTSGRLGALDAAECPPTFGTRPSQVIAVVAGGPAALRRAVEGAEDDEAAGARALRRLRVGGRDLICGISASSATPFVRGALREARRAGARTALVCCAPGSASRSLADRIIAPRTGPELIAGSTRLKAGTATKLVLNAISTAAMVELGKVYRGRMIDLQPTNAKLRARAERMLVELCGLTLPASRALLRRAGGQPRLALAMHLTGLNRSAAQRAVAHGGLRALDGSRPPGHSRGQNSGTRTVRRASISTAIGVPARTKSPKR